MACLWPASAAGLLLCFDRYVENTFKASPLSLPLNMAGFIWCISHTGCRSLLLKTSLCLSDPGLKLLELALLGRHGLLPIEKRCLSVLIDAKHFGNLLLLDCLR
jgi:hypothetical protein